MNVGMAVGSNVGLGVGIRVGSNDGVAVGPYDPDGLQKCPQQTLQLSMKRAGSVGWSKFVQHTVLWSGSTSAQKKGSCSSATAHGVGSTDGAASVGAEEGTDVVGAMVGDGDGAAIGVAVGLGDGAIEGADDGATVGLGHVNAQQERRQRVTMSPPASQQVSSFATGRCPGTLT